MINTSLDTDINQHFQDAIDVIQQHSNNSYYDSEYPHYETLGTQHQSLQCQITCCLVSHPSDAPAPVYDWNDTSWPQVIPDVSLNHSVPAESPHFYSILPPQRSSKGRKKLRLYEYLHEALNDPNMGDSIQWTDSGTGTFHFISKNKEKLAECWGQRKGNRKTMTYQKMARALRNYSRTGEIVKVRRKLTYQFNPDILHRLGSEQSYFSSTAAVAADWHSWYGHYQLQEDYDLASSFTSHSTTKL
uniref:Spi-C transcription factor (Spi-1/PU.1 related) n=1 Tax=Lates calcarifer TaxID=8187 RepID=A0A4W6FFT0_LATCA